MWPPKCGKNLWCLPPVQERFNDLNEKIKSVTSLTQGGYGHLADRGVTNNINISFTTFWFSNIRSWYHACWLNGRSWGLSLDETVSSLILSVTPVWHLKWEITTSGIFILSVLSNLQPSKITVGGYWKCLCKIFTNWHKEVWPVIYRFYTL